MKTSHHRTASGKSSRYIAGLAPLLLSLAVSQAYALDRTVTGANGAVGAAGTTASPNGGTGGAALDLTDTSLTGGAFNRLTLTGGNGGTGGAGLPGVVLDPDSEDCRDYGYCQYSTGGLGGNGGKGAAALGRVYAAGMTGGAGAEAKVFGGNGGNVGAGDWTNFTMDPTLNNAGAGGNASSFASAAALSGAVSASAYATGGNGGDVSVMLAGRGGDGGKATASAAAYSTTGNVTVLAQATGGNGGGANNFYAPAGAGAAVYLENMVAGATRGVLSLLQRAIGGNGGLYVGSAGGPPDEPTPPVNNHGGSAGSVLKLSDSQASALKATISATGGTSGQHSSGPARPNAGDARAELSLTSTRGGAGVEGTVTAIGGDVADSAFGGAGGAAGNASAIGRLTGTAAVSGSAEARGGQWGDVAASATSLLTINAGGLATGSARAVGGLLGGAYRHSWENQDGDASATLELVGAGASGTSYAQGGNATSSVNATTTGARAVSVESRAIAGSGDPSNPRGHNGDAKASTIVNAATTGGRAAVTAGAYAWGSGGSQNAQANLQVKTGGDIVGTAQAQAGVFDYLYIESGNSEAIARGVTSGAHAVTLNALANSTFALPNDGRQSGYGKSTANAYGASGSGVVTVAAQALSGMNYFRDRQLTSARAVAETSLRGGVSNASASARGEQMEAVATATAIGANGAKVGFVATAAGDFAQGTAAASNRFDAASFALKSGNGTAGDNQLYAYAAAAPDSGAALGLSAATSAAMSDLYAVGMHGGSGAADASQTAPALGASTSEFQFVSAVDQHLLIAFLSAGGTGFDTLDLSISSHGNLLFSQSFTSLSDANLFFTDRVLDLGLFGAGAQDIVVRSSLAGAAYGYAFNYVLGGGGLGGVSGGVGGIGGGAGVSAVPEESSWMMMMIGLSGLVIVARRRKSAATRA
ncbi:MAG TPA: hypothetical protein VF616_33695 [Duganella sp.]|uniref:beta strand repeat-containing protein n=1 Tax=Duganella sp. TaxID=1904440 RepID=UPI002ED633A0